MKYKCIKCNMLFNNNGACIRHQNNCNLGNHIIEEYNSGISFRDLVIKYHSNFGTIKRFLEDNNVHIRTEEENLKIKSVNSSKHRHSEEVKEKLSQLRKDYLKDNPDKHPWKKKEKFISVPCENFKKVLDELDIKYISEYTPSNERSFSIDIFLPQYKIGIEINGNQHYNREGSLQIYYQERHDFLINLGLEIHELHYSLFFDKEKMINLINSIIANKLLFDFDYDNYLLNKLNKNKVKSVCKTCGEEVYRGNNRCRKCFDKSRQKLDRPTLEQLLKDVEELGYCGSGRKYGVSDASIRKWIKKAS